MINIIIKKILDILSERDIKKNDFLAGDTKDIKVDNVVKNNQNKDIININKLVNSHLNRLNIVDKNTNRKKLLKLCEFIGLVENNGNTFSNTVATSSSGKTTSAKGLYQFVSGSVVPSINRTKKYVGELYWFKELRKTKDFNTISREKQTLLLLGDLLEKKGSDKYFKEFLNEDEDVAIEIYFNLHHTSKEELSEKNLIRIMNIFDSVFNEGK